MPGRIEVLGKHTDYAGGRSLLCTVGRGFCVAASPRKDRILRVVDAGRRLEVEVPLDPGLVPAASGGRIYVEAVWSSLPPKVPTPCSPASRPNPRPFSSAPR